MTKLVTRKLEEREKQIWHELVKYFMKYNLTRERISCQGGHITPHKLHYYVAIFQLVSFGL